MRKFKKAFVRLATVASVFATALGAQAKVPTKARNMDAAVGTTFDATADANVGKTLHKPLYCGTIGTSNAGPIYGVRIYGNKQEGYIATLDQVFMWHHSVVSFNDKPLGTIRLRPLIYCAGVIYFGVSGFHLSLDSELDENVSLDGSQIYLEYQGNQIGGNLKKASNAHSDYCDQEM